jgi:hypothetical protein
MRCRPRRLVHRTHDTWSSSVSDSASGSVATHTKPSTSETQTAVPGNKRDACRYALMLCYERAIGLNHFLGRSLDVSALVVVVVVVSDGDG